MNDEYLLERSQYWATSALVQVQVQLGCRLRVLGLGLGVLELKLHEEKNNFNAMLTKMEAMRVS